MYLNAYTRVYTFSISNVTREKPFSYRKDLITLFFDVAKNNTPRFSPTFLPSTSTRLLRVWSHSSHLPSRIKAHRFGSFSSISFFHIYILLRLSFAFPHSSFSSPFLRFDRTANKESRRSMSLQAPLNVRPRLRFDDVHVYADSRRRHCHYYYHRITNTGCHFASLSLAFLSYCFNGK